MPCNYFVYFRGAGPGCNTKELSDKLGHLKKEIEDLDDLERRLDEQKMWVQKSLKNISEDPNNEQHAYVTHEDICKCFSGETLLAVQAPSGTQLEVPIPEPVSQYLLCFMVLFSVVTCIKVKLVLLGNRSTCHMSYYPQTCRTSVQITLDKGQLNTFIRTSQLCQPPRF